MPPSIFHHPLPDEEGYQIFLGPLEEDASAQDGQHRQRALHVPVLSSRVGTRSCLHRHTSRPARTAEPPKGPAYSRTARYRWEFPETMDIFTADLDGKNLKRLTDTPGYDAEASYSPDGSQIVFTSFRDGDGEIYIMDAVRQEPAADHAPKGYDGGPFFSPDGRRIIYRSDRKGNDLLQVYVNNTEGTAERALTQNEFVNWGPYWHPDGTHIIYATSKHGHSNYELYLMNVDTGAEERITYHEGFDGLPVFSPDGKRLMWTSSGRTADRKSQLFIADFTLERAKSHSTAPAGALIVPLRDSSFVIEPTQRRRIEPWARRTSS